VNFYLVVTTNCGLQQNCPRTDCDYLNTLQDVIYVSLNNELYKCSTAELGCPNNPVPTINKAFELAKKWLY
jgi:hypothetical protein